MLHEHDAPIDAFLDPTLREHLEDRFWRPIHAQARLEVLRDDAGFLTDPTTHPALFADHGVVHVRDIAAGLIELGELANGVLLPHRPVDRQQFVLAYGVLAAYLHDIGMYDQTPEGRRVHAIYAAHVAFSDAADDVVDQVLVADGPVARRLGEVDRGAPFDVPLDLALRELLSLALAHSKSTVPAAVLDDRHRLRRLLQRAVFTDLTEHRASGRTPTADDPAPIAYSVNHHRYHDPQSSFAWLDAEGGPQAELADDVIDAVRLLRAADALRQRGTTLRTSGGYEICIDAATGRAVYTLRTADGEKAYLLSYHDEKGAGEANVKVATITPSGHLRVAFHRGAFHTASAVRHATRGAAHVIADIAADVLPSFRATAGPGAPAPDAMRIELERPSDRPDFADDLVRLLLDEQPHLAGRVRAVADVESAAPHERDRYHHGRALDADGTQADDLLAKMAVHGANVGGIDRRTAFADVCLATVEPGEVLVALGSPPAFVYVPTSAGLIVVPGGGYAREPLRPWVPVGTTGVVRRAERNADIVAERRVDVFMIPGAVYASAWFHPYEPEQLVEVLARQTGGTA
jgi:hypothetical protein